MKKIREFLIDFYPLPQCQTAHSSGSPSALHLLSLLCGFLVTLSLKSLVQGCSGRWRLPGPAAETRGLPHSHPLRSKHGLGKKKKKKTRRRRVHRRRRCKRRKSLEGQWWAACRFTEETNSAAWKKRDTNTETFGQSDISDVFL